MAELCHIRNDIDLSEYTGTVTDGGDLSVHVELVGVVVVLLVTIRRPEAERDVAALGDLDAAENGVDGRLA